MEGEQFSLCWNNFHSNLSSGFNSLLKDEDLVDVTLAAGGRFMKAHKTVLSVCSPFFKELFRANPSKHPIVILPDVNYNALCNLLQFMYQGEVSVSQEEIPMFMRVAEMLKVKGLTDNSSSSSSSSESNGYSGPSRIPYNFSDQRQIMKRPRPVKKVIKPMQPLRPIDSPKPRSPHPPPAKKPHIEENTARQEEQEFPEALVKPKEEPVDDSESNTSQKFEENNLDLSTMLDTKIGESSNWQTSEIINKPQDSSTPGGGLMLIKSGRGQLVLIHQGHIYIHCDTTNNRHMWVCVKKKTLNCEGCLTTLNGPILLSYSEHNHPQLQDVIQRLQVPSCSVSPELM
ncbi:protein bric-a-brac 1-like isoform X2 [Tribolium madens]|uniref:protein bric-a-brac 1-like isoform X2 n=1 Tax=Tribolium madens TaxID=41895 RepID=UPI001CF755C8|nr:protein bric-a-brac 1-like isoform X2 [Tribolium madens]